MQLNPPSRGTRADTGQELQNAIPCTFKDRVLHYPAILLIRCESVSVTRVGWNCHQAGRILDYWDRLGIKVIQQSAQ